MNRLRAIAIEEQRQLITFGFAVAVFLMTLLALQLHNEGSTLNGIGNASHEGAIHGTRQDSAVSSQNRAVALAAMPSLEGRRDHN